MKAYWEKGPVSHFDCPGTRRSPWFDGAVAEANSINSLGLPSHEASKRKLPSFDARRRHRPGQPETTCFGVRDEQLSYESHGGNTESFCGAWRANLIVSILDDDTIEVPKSCTTNTRNASASARSTALRKAMRSASEPRTLCQCWYMVRKSSLAGPPRKLRRCPVLALGLKYG